MTGESFSVASEPAACSSRCIEAFISEAAAAAAAPSSSLAACLSMCVDDGVFEKVVQKAP